VEFHVILEPPPLTSCRAASGLAHSFSLIASLALRLLQKTHLRLDRATRVVVAIEGLADQLDALSERHGPTANRDKSKLFRHGTTQDENKDETISINVSSAYSPVSEV